MKIKPVSINGNLCKEFNSCSIEDLDVIAGGYIFTPRGEIIVVKDEEEHHTIFSKYINAYLEKQTEEVYDIFTATKMICELGCIVYSGVRLEYIKNKLGGLDNTVGSLTFPNDIDNITENQKEICLHLISTNKSIIGNNEKIYIQYGSFPDNVYSKEQVVSMLQSNIDKKEIS